MSEITIIGGINIDIEGRPEKKLVYRDSNIGHINMSYGGVGRNICENVARLGGDVAMISVIGDDYMGSGALNQLRELGVDVSSVHRIEGMNTSMYLSILDDGFDMELGLNDMKIVENIDSELILMHRDQIALSSVLALDGNLEEELINFAASIEGPKLFYDPVSVNKAERAKNIIGKFFAVKPNVMEAEILTDISIRDEQDVKRAARILKDKGVNQVYITLGKDGVYYLTDDEEGFLRPKDDIRLISATGCGDSFSACILIGIAGGMSAHEIAAMGMAASSITMEAVTAVNPLMSIDELKKRM